jgi:DNA-binding transcriptional MocR family regulator
VRALAGRLGTSPATVSSAYRTLRTRGLVTAAGRRGTRVAPRPAIHPPAAARPAAASPGLRDLTIGLADPELLPALRPALERVALTPDAAGDGDEPDTELLAFAHTWFNGDGIPAESLAVVSGAMDGVERVLAAHLRTGDRVLIEDPGYPPIRDVLRALGLVEVPVPVDERGVRPDGLSASLRAERAKAIVIVPRAQNPTGAAFDAERAAALRDVLIVDPELLVLEDDHVSLVSGAPFHSAIAPDRQHWALVRSTSKLLHPDLRVALLAGDETTVARVEGRQSLGPRYVSRLLQRTAATLLRAPDFTARCARASQLYAGRRRALLDALTAREVAATGVAGLNVWVPVREEAAAVRAVADAGWLVTPGERFRAAAPPAVRITTATLRDGEAELIADALAQVVHSGRARGGY